MLEELARMKLIKGMQREELPFPPLSVRLASGLPVVVERRALNKWKISLSSLGGAVQ